MIKYSQFGSWSANNFRFCLTRKQICHPNVLYGTTKVKLNLILQNLGLFWRGLVRIELVNDISIDISQWKYKWFQSVNINIKSFIGNNVASQCSAMHWKSNTILACLLFPHDVDMCTYIYFYVLRPAYRR